MIQDLLASTLRCPECLGELTLSIGRRTGAGVETGALHCARCPHTFPIAEGMAFFGVQASAAALRRQEIEAEFRWNFEMHDAAQHMAFAEETFRKADEAIRRLAAIVPPPARVLDVGAGCGYHTWQLIRHGYEAVAAELQPEGLAYGDACCGPGVRFARLVTDCSLLPIAGGAFDAVFCKELAHHVEDLAGLLAEFRRVLAPGGVLVLIEPYWPRRRPGAPAVQDPAREAGLTHQNYGLHDYLRALRRQGFRVLRLKINRAPADPADRRLRRRVEALVERPLGLCGWGGWGRLKRWRARWTGGEVLLLARRGEPAEPDRRRREIEVLSPERLDRYRDEIARMRANVPAFMELLEKISGK